MIKKIKVLIKPVLILLTIVGLLFPATANAVEGPPGLKLDLQRWPTGSVNYYPEDSNIDPWDKGRLEVSTSGPFSLSAQYVIRYGSLLTPDILDLPAILKDSKDGLANAVRIKLPKEITGQQFIDGLDEQASYLQIMPSSPDGLLGRLIQSIIDWITGSGMQYLSVNKKMRK